MPESTLVELITETFIQLFPLVILAPDTDPIPAVRAYLEPEEEHESETREPLSIQDIAVRTHLPVEIIARWVQAIKRKGQAVFYDPPGTGKTFVAGMMAEHLPGSGSGTMETIRFHPSYSYEEFMEGIRPRTNDNGKLDYPTVPGRFVAFCDDARLRKDPCVMVIDEINRADLSRVFGELMFLLEYRNRSMMLPSGRSFMIPDNVYVIGTMNTADRSIALVDHALRRRFAFIALHTEYDVIRKYYMGTAFQTEGLIGILKTVNDAIGDVNLHLGVSFFLNDAIMRGTADVTGSVLRDIWELEIEPYLEEIFFDRPDRVNAFR